MRSASACVFHRLALVSSPRSEVTPHECPFAIAKTNWTIDLKNPASDSLGSRMADWTLTSSHTPFESS